MTFLDAKHRHNAKTRPLNRNITANSIACRFQQCFDFLLKGNLLEFLLTFVTPASVRITWNCRIKEIMVLWALGEACKG